MALGWRGLKLMDEKAKFVVDAGIATVAIATPIWIEHVQSAAITATVVLGLIVAGIRLAIIWREYRRG